MHKKFLFLFGLVFLPACLHKTKVKCRETEASEKKIEQIQKGVALVTPSSALKSLRLISKNKKDMTSFDVPSAMFSSSVKKSSLQSKEVIKARLTDIPYIMGSTLIDATLDDHGSKSIVYKINGSCADIYSFYDEEFKKNGWESDVYYSDMHLIVMVAKKPHKNAALIGQFFEGKWLASNYVLVKIVIH